jgi:hypothetical protein
VQVSRTRLSFPFTTTLTGVRLTNNTESEAFSIQRITVRPRWLSIPRRILWITSIDIENPLVRVTRDERGTTHWPAMRRPFKWEAAIGLLPWRVHADSLNISGGTIDFVDREPGVPFHGVLDHVSVSFGPVLLPLSEAHRVALAEGRSVSMSYAMRGRFSSRQGDTAPFYCSGWADLTAKDLQVSCQVEPVPLSAFEPYVRGESQLRAYNVTVQSASHWVAKANQLTGRLQLQLGNLIEGDFSFRGRTIIDVKKLFSAQPGRLIGSVNVSGPLDKPDAWDAEFLAGDPLVQALVERLFEYGVRLIKVPVGHYTLYVRIAPATPEMMTDVEGVSREVQEALELLAGPLSDEARPSPLPAVEPPPVLPAPALPAPIPPEPVPPAPDPTQAPSPTSITI